VKASTPKVSWQLVNNLSIAAIILFIATAAFAQDSQSSRGKEIYDQIAA
jgi:low affinity Fe/Cu permease